MALEARRVEKDILFDLLKAQKLNPVIAELNEIHEIIFKLKATMEPEDVELVVKQVNDFMQTIK